MSTAKKTRAIALVLILLAVVLLAYTGSRAGLLSFTYDEAWTTYYVDDDVGVLLSGVRSTANHHMLNTVLMKVSRKLFGAGDLVYRLPNLAAHGLYLAAAVFLAMRLAGGWLAVVAFALINLNPFMLDFFSLARGYGLSLGMGMAALALLVAEGAAPSWWKRLGAFVLAALGVLASFPVLLVFLAMLGVQGLLVLENLRGRSLNGRRLAGRWLRQMAGPLVVGTLLLAVIQKPLRVLRAGKELYFGGVDGFWADTVSSLVASSLYQSDAPYLAMLLVKVLIVLTLTGAVVMAAAQVRRRENLLGRSPLAMVLLVLVAAALGSALQHYLLGVRLLLERTALILVPLFMLVMAGTLAEWSRQDRRRMLAPAAAILLVGLVTFNTARAANFTHTYSWRFDAATRQVVDELERRHAQQEDPDAETTLLVSWPFKMSVRYYIRLRGLTWLKEEVFDYVKERGGYDYYYILGESFDVGYTADHGFLQCRRDDILQSYPSSGAVLIQDHGGRP